MQTARSTLLGRLREARGLSRKALEAASGVPESTIVRLERGQEPSLDDARALARALDVTIDFLWPAKEEAS